MSTGIFIHRWTRVWACVVLSACASSKPDATATASDCGGTCPAGTWRDEVRQTRAGSTNRVDFVEGQCSWSCVALADCPTGMVPVITADCFTCARAMPGGTLAGGDCASESWFANRTDAPDGAVATGEIGGSAEREERVRFEQITILDAWDPDFQPRGLAALSDTLYVGDHAAGLIHHLDIETGIETGVTEIGDLNPTDLAVSETTIWVADGGIFGFDLATGEATATIDRGDDDLSITWNGTHLIEIRDTRMVFRDPTDLSIRDEDRLEAALPGPAASGPGRLLSALAVESTPHT
ncbi:MAG TPA: hypothetical protein DFR83_17640, partial [Deltaproteobacteria bacterium]|nr:hypothetical protein [Deltaproteobacteria bacterium]